MFADWSFRTSYDCPTGRSGPQSTDCGENHCRQIAGALFKPIASQQGQKLGPPLCRSCSGRYPAASRRSSWNDDSRLQATIVHPARIPGAPSRQQDRTQHKVIFSYIIDLYYFYEWLYLYAVYIGFLNIDSCIPLKAQTTIILIIFIWTEYYY